MHFMATATRGENGLLLLASLFRLRAESTVELGTPVAKGMEPSAALVAQVGSVNFRLKFGPGPRWLGWGIGGGLSQRLFYVVSRDAFLCSEMIRASF